MNQTNVALSTEEVLLSKREFRKRKFTAFAFVFPLLLFILFAFVAPITLMLYRSFYHPAVANLIPVTLERLNAWDGNDVPDNDTFNSMALDLKRLAEERLSGKLAEEINRALPGSSSIVKSSARKVRRVENEELSQSGFDILIDANSKWSSTEIWRAVRQAGQVYTPSYYLTALDLEINPDGGIQARESARIYVKLYTKTLRIALIITLLTLILGYPLAYYLANAPNKTANLLMVFVLLPFWTSLLVRTTSWIALLQTNGVTNSTFMALGLTSSPIEMLYTQFSTIIAMTHILLTIYDLATI